MAADRCRVGGQVRAFQNESANAGVLLKRAQGRAQNFLPDHRQIDFGIGFGKHPHPFPALFETQDVEASGAGYAGR